jgi:uncharacterized damage-inducible protein DinB
MGRTTLVVVIWMASLAPAFAEQSAATAGPDPAVRSSFDDVSSWVLKAAEAVPADKYAYRPVATVRTFGQLVAHVADGYTYFCAMAGGKKVEWSDAIEKGAADKAAIVARLKQAGSACAASYASGQARPLIENVAHTNLHYGNIVTYMRMLGLVPPSS